MWISVAVMSHCSQACEDMEYRKNVASGTAKPMELPTENVSVKLSHHFIIIFNFDPVPNLFLLPEVLVSVTV